MKKSPRLPFYDVPTVFAVQAKAAVVSCLLLFGAFAPTQTLWAQPAPSEQLPVEDNPEIPVEDENSIVTPDDLDENEDAPRAPIVKTDPYAQERFNEKKIASAEWERATKGIRFTKQKEKEKVADKKATNTDVADDGKELTTALSTFAIAMKWFFIVVAIGLIALLVYRMVTNGDVFAPASRRLNRDGVAITLDNLEDHLAEADLDPMITDAVRTGQFALALRLYYLAILRELHLHGTIVWQREKTNRVYLRELRNHPLFEPLRTLTRQFERVWYGMMPLDKTEFSALRPQLEDLLRSVRRNGK